DVARGGASIDGTPRDATGRPWPAGPAPARLSTKTTPVATPARVAGQIGESGDSNERVRAAGGGGQGSRAAGLDASTGRTGSQRPSGRHDPSRVEWPATAPTSSEFVPDAVLARRSQYLSPKHKCLLSPISNSQMVLTNWTTGGRAAPRAAARRPRRVVSISSRA